MPDFSGLVCRPKPYWTMSLPGRSLSRAISPTGCMTLSYGRMLWFRWKTLWGS